MRNNSLALLVGITITLLGFGLLMSYSSSAIIAGVQYHDDFYFIKRQFVGVGMGILAFVVGFYLSSDLYRRFAYPLYFFSLLLLVLVLIPHIGIVAGGARRWLGYGAFRFQAGEFFKFALIVYLAASLTKKGSQMSLFHVGIIPHAVLPGIGMGLLMLEPDFGTTIVTAVVTVILLFIGGARIAYLLAGLLFMLPLVYHVVATSPYRLERIMAFLDPWGHRQDSGYQIVESLLALGSGGWFGQGVGQSHGKLFFLPAAHTDFVLSIIGEEWGFFGVLLILACFGVMLFVGMRAAYQEKNPFRCYLITGITTLLVLQASVNALVVFGLLPTKGITLPFVSYGGSSIMMACLMMGILAKLSIQENQEKKS